MTEEYGIGFHCHHEVLYEVVTSYSHRVDCIKATKPADEQETRLRLFAMILENQLPGAVLKALVPARKAYARLKAKWDIYVAALDTLSADYWASYNLLEPQWVSRAAALKVVALRKVYLTKREALENKHKAEILPLDNDYMGKYQALVAALGEHAVEMVALHAQLCTDCPWDGQTIFPGEHA